MLIASKKKSEWKILGIKKRDIGIVEKARKQDWALWANTCVHLLLNAFMNNEWYLHTQCGMQEINPHHILCSRYSYTRANNLIPISIPFHIHCRSCSVMYMYMCSLNLILLNTTLTQKVIGMPLIHLQSCIDQDVIWLQSYTNVLTFPELVF